MSNELITQDQIIPGLIKQRHLCASDTIANGDLYYGDGNNSLIRLPVTINGQILSLINNVPAWSDLSVILADGTVTVDGVQVITNKDLTSLTNTFPPATAGGSDTQIQFNDGGILGGISGSVYDKVYDSLTISNKSLYLQGTDSTNSSDEGGVIYIQSGFGFDTKNGGNIGIICGDGGDNSHGGEISIHAGFGGVNTGKGGEVEITTGGSQGGDNDSGNLRLETASPSGTGNCGKVMIREGNSSSPTHYYAILDTLSLTADRTFTFPDASGTFALTSDIDISYSDTRFKLGTFTYNTATASGTQSITGVGFQPKLIKFKLALNGYSIKFSDGTSDGTNNYCIYSPAASQTGGFQYTGSYCIVSNLGTDSASATCTMDADGFTLSWTKTNSPTGTMSIIYEVFR
jgi:hypothetical protein